MIGTSDKASQDHQPSIRMLNRSIADVADPQIVRIVATVDAMASRGSADGLIAPLRHRLGALRPMRPLRLARLLFHPLDPLIVSPATWRPEQGTVPRTAIAQMAAVVKTALGSKAAAIEAAIHNRTIDDEELITALGRTLWPQAAEILFRSVAPDSWTTTGLDNATYLDLARKIGAVLSQAPNLDALTVETAQGLLQPSTDAIAVVLHNVAERDADALPMLVALLLQRLPQSRQLLSTIETGASAAVLRAATDQASRVLLDQLERLDGTVSMVAAPSLTASAMAAGRIGALLNEVGGENASPGMRRQARTLRQRLDTDCKARFANALGTDLLTPLHNLPVPTPISRITALESAARGLRTFESEARKVGSGASYDQPLAHAAEVVRTLGDGALRLVDRVRLVEILAGSEAAMAMLERPGGRGA